MLADEDLIAQLSLRDRAVLYLRAAGSYFPIWLVFPLGMIAAQAFAQAHWMSDPKFTRPSWAQVAFSCGMDAFLLAWALLVGYCQRLDRPGKIRWEATGAILMSLGCAWAMVGPLAQSSEPHHSKAAVQAAYAKDLNVAKQAAHDKDPGANAWREEVDFDWTHGQVAAELDHSKTMSWLLDKAAEQGLEWPSLAQVEEEAMEENADVVAWRSLAPFAFFCLLQIMFVSQEDLKEWIAGWNFSGSPTGAAQALRKVLGLPAKAWSWAKGAGGGAARAMERRVLADPRMRAEYERKALEASAAKAPSVGEEGARRL